jgi:hypothetical protein
LKIRRKLTTKGRRFSLSWDFLRILIELFHCREEAQTKMILIRDKEDKDKQQHYTELKEVIRVINHDKKLKEFMKIKTQERAEDEELLNYRKKKGQIDNFYLMEIFFSTMFISVFRC